MIIIYKIIGVVKYFFPKRIKKIEKDLIKILENNWITRPGKVIILIEGLLETPVSIIEKSRIAKAIEERNGGISYAILKGFYPGSNRTSFLFQAMGIYNFIGWWSICFRPYILIKSLIDTYKIYKNCKSGEKLLEIKHNDILIGDLIYDSILRHNPGLYTIDEIKGLNIYRIIMRSYMTLHANELIIRKLKPTHLITSHVVYAEFGLLARQASYAGCVVHLKDMSVYYVFKDKSEIHDHYLSVDKSQFELAMQDELIQSKAQKYFENRFSGHINELDVKNAFNNKKKYEKSDLLYKYTGSPVSKKLNVVIFAHAFSDAPHVGSGMIFKDYYEWLKFTISEVSKLEKYNVFVKEHPGSYLYGEKGVVSEIIEMGKYKSTYLLPEDLNTISVRDLSDVVITAQGTAGLEFSAIGKPVLTAGKTYYSSRGIANAARDKNEYKEFIDKLEKLALPSDYERKMALTHLYLTFSKLNRSDVLPTKDILPGDDARKLYDASLYEFLLNLERGIKIKDDFYTYVMND